MSSKIDYKEINKLIKLMEEKNLSNFELEIEGFKIKINKDQPPDPVPESATVPQGSPESEEKESHLPQDTTSQESKNDLHCITSPMVGTFYSAPDPSSSPFVEIGDTVKINQTLCIIEAMKLMNEIESDIDGILKEVYVKNGNPVEYGQKLFAIQPVN